MKFGIRTALVAAAVTCAFVIGCKEPSDGIKPEDHQALSSAATIAQKVDGDYDKLSDAEKQEMLKVAGNNENQARSLLKMMAHPPNEAMKNAHGAPPGGGAAKGGH